MPELPTANFASSLLSASSHNPDVLSCLANLSNDEVFTPPNVANAMLDMLPQELFKKSATKFLDPVCKSGVFLREITKRLMLGLEKEFPDQQKRLDHILHNQVYGIAITELTSLLSRRTLYCAKYANSPYSISKFANIDGNIRFKSIQHTWKNGKCIFCGASRSQYEREEGLENHAYEFIHNDNPQEIFENMKFDVIIGNPPYQLDTGGSGRQAIPLYNLFVNCAKKLNPTYLLMIIPARWFAGGMGLEDFRLSMMKDKHLCKFVDFVNAKDCFPQNSISGGVCYFLWDKNYNGKCDFVSNISGKVLSLKRYLDEFPILVRYNQAISILRKIKNASTNFLSTSVSSISPFGIPTKERGYNDKKNESDLILNSSNGTSYISKSLVLKGKDYINCYKVIVSQTSAEHAGEADKSGMFKVLTSTMKVLGKNEVCTHSYIIVGKYENQIHADNLLNYLKTKFVRFLILIALSSIHISKQTFCFVPINDFSKSWTDDELYTKYDLTQDEIDFIESMIKPMEILPDADNEAENA